VPADCSTKISWTRVATFLTCRSSIIMTSAAFPRSARSLAESAWLKFGKMLKMNSKFMSSSRCLIIMAGENRGIQTVVERC
jgi:hypothetical protein